MVVIAAAAGCYSGAEVAPDTASSGNTTTGDAGPTSSGNANDPFAAAPTCTSGQTSSASEGGGMAPGNACVTCHSTSGGPRFKIGGTVYPSGHEPNDCLGTNAGGLTVVITDANNQVINLKVNSSGNFYSSSRQSIAMPYHAKVVDSAGAERAMASSQTTGDCNSCHTQDGANGAPGRIVAP